MNEQKKESTVQSVTFSPIMEETVDMDKKQLQLLTDVSLHVSFELGRAKKTIHDILELKKGSIIRLDKLAGEHVAMLVNKAKIAEGEIVVVDDRFAIRITDIVSIQERERKMK
ncbi:flagellar motor switch protein FliN [Ectobacillus sp. sgz5001026]|uniref:flagellar motor switch protein FliN n=1 Tax=Ectobacillus sp. sgz5001026 TaxID=3242473 RepID=UPI0036D2CF90